MLKISDLVEEIKSLDELIKKHKQFGDSTSIISQYEHKSYFSKKNTLPGELDHNLSELEAII